MTRRTFQILGLAAVGFAAVVPTPGQTTTTATTRSVRSFDGATTPIERANADAVARLYAQLVAERVDGVGVGDLIDAVGGWSMVFDGCSRARQIGGPRAVTADLVQVTREIDGATAAGLILEAVAARPERSPLPPSRLSQSLEPWAGRTFRATGDSADDHDRPGRVPSGERRLVDAAPPVISERPPAWIDEAITARAASASAGTPLQTARAAEAAARGVLRDQIGQLKLDEARTVATAGPASGRAVDLAVEAARIAGVDYRADGSVEVRVSIDGRQVWRALQLPGDGPEAYAPGSD